MMQMLQDLDYCDGHNLVAAKTHELEALRAKLYGTYCDKNE